MILNIQGNEICTMIMERGRVKGYGGVNIRHNISSSEEK